MKKCEHALPLVEAYIDRELDLESAAQLELHIDNCRACAARLQQLRAENELYAGYERSLEFDSALWNGVRSRLRATSTRHGVFSWLFEVFAAPRISIPVTMALVLLAVGVTARLMKTVDQTPPELTQATIEQSHSSSATEKDSGSKSEKATAQEQTTSVNRQSTPAAEHRRSGGPPAKRIQRPTPQQLVREAEMKYLAAITLLSRRIAKQENTLTPEARLKFEETLAAIDRNIAATRQAVLKHPEDPLAVHYMLTAYSRKVEVLREMTGY